MFRKSRALTVRVKQSQTRYVAYSLFFPVLILLAWVAAGAYEALNPYFYPPPGRILSSALNLLSTNFLLLCIFYSLARIVAATLISSVISIPLGILMASNESWRGLLDFMVKLRYLPAFALMPLLMIMVGVDEANKIIFLVISITLYFLPSVIVAIDSVPGELIDTARTLGASERQVVSRVLIPAAMPDIFQSFLVINGIGWNGLMVAEIINAKHGLGHLLNMARQRGQMDAVIVALIIIYLFAVIMDVAIKFAVKRMFKWKYE